MGHDHDLKHLQGFYGRQLPHRTTPFSTARVVKSERRLCYIRSTRGFHQLHNMHKRISFERASSHASLDDIMKMAADSDVLYFTTHLRNGFESTGSCRASDCHHGLLFAGCVAYCHPSSSKAPDDDRATEFSSSKVASRPAGSPGPETWILYVTTVFGLLRWLCMKATAPFPPHGVTTASTRRQQRPHQAPELLQQVETTKSAAADIGVICVTGSPSRLVK